MEGYGFDKNVCFGFRPKAKDRLCCIFASFWTRGCLKGTLERYSKGFSLVAVTNSEKSVSELLVSRFL